MTQYTTPTFTLTLPDTVDLTLATDIIVTFASQNGIILCEKSGADLDVSAHSIDVWLAQEETARFPTGSICIQVNWTNVSGNATDRFATDIARVRSNANLHKAVM